MDELVTELKLWAASPRVPEKVQLLLLEAIGRLSAQPEAVPMAELIGFLESRRRSHYYCEDSWYSCPKSPDGCSNESEGDACNCGVDAWNAELDAMLERLRPQMREDSK
jgi:hypothetical protein